MSNFEDLINNIMADKFHQADQSFDELMASKVDAALAQEKVAVAAEIYNGGEKAEFNADAEDGDDEDDIDIDDIDLEDIDWDEIDGMLDDEDEDEEKE